MKGKNLIFVGIIALIAGIVMLIFHTDLASGGIVIAAGALFVGAGVLNMLVFLNSRDKEGRARIGVLGTAFGWVASAAAVILGLAMLLFPHTFVALVGFMFAVLLLFMALFQMFVLLFGSRPTRLSSWYFFVPTLLVGAAVFTFMHRPDQAGEDVSMLVTAVAIAVFGIFTVMEGSTIGANNHATLKAAKTAAQTAEAENKKEETAQDKE